MTEQTYTPQRVADAFTTIRSELDVIEQAYGEAIAQPVPPQQAFQVWDSTAPGFLEAQGLPRLKCPSESNFFPTSARGAPDLAWIAANAVPKFADDDPLSIDIECYGKKDVEGEYPYTAQEIEWLRSVVQCFQDGNIGQRVGIYMTPPERYGGCSSYPVGHPEVEKRWNSWTERNKVMLPLANQVWAMFPSLYGLYSDMEQWVRFAKQNVEQCRMLNATKPVIGYLWPEWHNNAEASGPIDYDDWMTMLETLFACCDGIAIWHWSSARFEPEADYWRATVDFMTKHKLNGYG